MNRTLNLRLSRFIVPAWGLSLFCSSPGLADLVKLQAPAYSNHPHLMPARTEVAWRRGLGNYGETFVRENLQLRGYKVYSIQNASGHGIDLIGIKRGPGGELIDTKLCEVKTGQKHVPRLGETSSRTQMSRRWLDNKLKQMRASGNPEFKELANEIFRFSRAQGVSIEQLGEVWRLNISKDAYEATRAVDNSKLFEGRITRSLQRIQQRAKSPEARAWATRHLAKFDQLRSASMSQSFGGHAPRLHMTRPSWSPPVAGSTGRMARIGRWGGRASPVILAAMEAYIVIEYTRGNITTREFAHTQAQFVGALAGGLVGAKAGAVAGLPFGPIGVKIGAILGGLGGALAGSYAGDAVVSSHYKIRDAEQEKKFEQFVYRHYGVPRE